MKLKDKISIFAALILVLLFIAKVSSNLLEEGVFSNARGTEKDTWVEDANRAMTRLKEAGLEPHEAKYYKVLDE